MLRLWVPSVLLVFQNETVRNSHKSSSRLFFACEQDMNSFLPPLFHIFWHDSTLQSWMVFKTQATFQQTWEMGGSVNELKMCGFQWNPSSVSKHCTTPQLVRWMVAVVCIHKALAETYVDKNSSSLEFFFVWSSVCAQHKNRRKKCQKMACWGACSIFVSTSLRVSPCDVIDSSHKSYLRDGRNELERKYVALHDCFIIK